MRGVASGGVRRVRARVGVPLFSSPVALVETVASARAWECPSNGGLRAGQPSCRVRARVGVPQSAPSSRAPSNVASARAWECLDASHTFGLGCRLRRGDAK